MPQELKPGDPVYVTISAHWQGHSFKIVRQGIVDKISLDSDPNSDPEYWEYWVWIDMPDIGKIRERVEQRFLMPLFLTGPTY